MRRLLQKTSFAITLLGTVVCLPTVLATQVTTDFASFPPTLAQGQAGANATNTDELEWSAPGARQFAVREVPARQLVASDYQRVALTFGPSTPVAKVDLKAVSAPFVWRTGGSEVHPLDFTSGVPESGFDRASCCGFDIDIARLLVFEETGPMIAQMVARTANARPEMEANPAPAYTRSASSRAVSFFDITQDSSAGHDAREQPGSAAVASRPGSAVVCPCVGDSCAKTAAGIFSALTRLITRFASCLWDR